MFFWGTAKCTGLRSQRDYSLIYIQGLWCCVYHFYQREPTRSIRQNDYLHALFPPWTFLLDPQWTLTPEELWPRKMKLPPKQPNPWLPLTLICSLQRKTTVIMSLFPASAVKACRGKWREIIAGEWTEDWSGQSIVVKLFIFLCQDKREINRRYWCWALGSLVSLLLCHLSLSLWIVILKVCGVCVLFVICVCVFPFLRRMSEECFGKT